MFVLGGVLVYISHEILNWSISLLFGQVIWTWVPTKVLEAMLHGAVVVTTPVGVEGIASNTSFPGYVVERGAEDTETYI